MPEVNIPETKLPEGLSDMCSKFPELCGRVEKLEQQVNKSYDLLSSHPKPLKEPLEKVWSDCPECSSLWEKWKQEIGEQAANKKLEEYKKEQETKTETKEKTKPEFPWMK